jgi:soluble lytic murein transglycosylase
LQLAFNKSELAYARFNQLTKLDATTRLWAVRAALIEHNWQHVDQALGNLSAKEKKQERWRYWQAKALLETNQREKGLAIFKQLANERSYYGYSDKTTALRLLGTTSPRVRSPWLAAKVICLHLWKNL